MFIQVQVTIFGSVITIRNKKTMYFNQQAFIKYMLYVQHYARFYKSGCELDPLPLTSYFTYLSIHQIIEPCTFLFLLR